MSKSVSPKNTLEIRLSFVIAIAFSVWLFLYSIDLPLEFRVRGDAYSYLAIAGSFQSLPQALLHTGEQSNGLPLLEYFLRQSDVGNWVFSIVALLFVLHISMSLYLCEKIVSRGWIRRNSPWHAILGTLLLTYPAMVTHTSVPLSDTLGVDLMIAAFCLLASPSVRWAWLASGLLMGYAILVRPAYELGILVGLITFAVFDYLSLRKNTSTPKIKRLLHSITPLVTALLFLLPTLLSCYSRYGELCVRDPKMFNTILSAQVGLKGARVLWLHPEIAQGKELPVLADSFMKSSFYDPCKLQSIFGTDDTSLTGCLVARPLSSALLLIKKWVGLFDPFQLQPYAENLTPVWYTFLSRPPAVMALLGQFVLLWLGLSWAYSWLRKKGPLPDPTLAAVYSFCLITLLAHLLLHVENRYGLVWVPFCLASLVWRASHLQTDQAKTRWTHLVLGALFISFYCFQVITWDNGL